MPTRDEAPIGAPCWIELFSSDADGACVFYAEVFGWKVEIGGPEFGGYVSFTLDDVPVAGGMRNDGEAGTPDGWSVYLSSENAAADVDAVVAHGGQVIVPAMPVGDMGTMAVVLDAGCAAVGSWEPGSHRGFGVIDEPGAPAWFELHTRDDGTSVAFYRDAFGWDTHVASDTPDFRYTTLEKGDDALAGIMDATAMLPDGAPAYWAVYFRCVNTDATLERIVELGGSVVAPAEDTPFGRLAVAADPTGASFRLASADR